MDLSASWELRLSPTFMRVFYNFQHNPTKGEYRHAVAVFLTSTIEKACRWAHHMVLP